jgi:hypothetical protein
MGILVNAVLATVCWLGFFEPHLILPLANRPLVDVLLTLTATDVAWWLLSFAITFVGMAVFDYYMTRRPRTANQRLWP